MKTNLVRTIVCGLMAIPLLVEAMPTKADFDKVSPVVADLMKPEQDALKAGKKTKTEVADAAIALVAQADGEAAKLLLAKGAFSLYVRDGQFDKALDTLKTMRAEVPDITPQYLANVIETALKRVPRKNGGQLYQILDETKTLARYQEEVKKLETQAKARPADKAVQTKLAEHYAVLGDWKKSLEHFAKGEDAKAAQMAKDEQDGAKDAKAIADFWWNYPNKRGEEFEKPFKQHAAALYSQAVAADTLVGLNKVQSERRIEEAKAMGEAICEAPADTAGKDGLYCVIDLSGGPTATKYPVSYLNDVPKGGWTDEYKTKKLVLRRIPAGKDPLGRYTISKDFFIGVFEVTQCQWKLVMGNNPARNKGDTLPVETVSWIEFRGSPSIAIGCGDVEVNSFTSRLVKRTGVTGFDLPTEAQWEYASRAGSKANCFFEGGNSGDYCWHNRISDGKTHSVGGKKPNDWGLYDVYGNVWERCLDCVTVDMLKGSDPVGTVNGKMCGNRGGQSGDPEGKCSSVSRAGSNLCNAHGDRGFRLAIQPPFVPPKQ